MIEYTKYSEYYTELASMHVALDEDPASIGIGSINRKIASIHAYKERTAAILTEAIANTYEREKGHRLLKLDYDLKFEKLLISDDQIKNLKSEGLRTAACNAKLPDEFLKMTSAEIDLNDSEGFLKVVQAKLNQLESANSNLSRQISVIELQVEVGEISRMAGNPFSSRTLTVK